MSERISFEIKALQSDATTPIPNAEIQLENINLGQKYKTNDNGIASFEIESTQHLKSFRAKLIHKDYQEYPIADRPITLNSIRRREKPLELRFREKLDNFAVQQIKLEPQTIILKDANNEVITKNFYKRGDTLTLTADIESNKAQESEIKWAYKILSLADIILLQQRDSKTYNPLNKIILNPDINNIPSELKQILQDKDNNAYFSNQSAYTIKDFKNNTQELESLYKGKTLTITIPTSFETSKQQVAIAIFAYIYEPNYEVCYIIHLNDYPQITIDCTLAETLRAYTRQDNIATLGWGVSYICQRLWHDNPSDAKELSELIYIDSHSIDFIESIPNATMQRIVKEVLPRITLQEFSKDSNNKCPAITSQMQEIKDKNLRFYVELDWDRFYMQFPLMKGLEDKILRVPAFENDINQFVKDSIKEMTYETFEYIRKTTGTPKILHNNFFDSAFYEKIIEWLKSDSIQKALQDIVSSKNTNAKLIVMLDNIYQGFTKNEKIFSLKGNDWKSDDVCKKQSLVDIKKPYKLWGQCMRAYGLGDTAFVSIFDFKEAVALYALTGKFNIYYIPSLFKITQGKDNAIDIQITEIKAYIFDGFDFIGTSGQFVGAWDYEKMEFIADSSIWQGYFKDNAVDMANKLPFVNLERNGAKDLKEVIMRNQDYQNTQMYFNLGLDFRIVTPTFKNIQVYPLSMPIQIGID
ncbi:DUF6402 family protein [Helicobacter trogontum]|uniref:DUF6402 family protein n=1 Tax=Helicobacter trogontum TaxID=50960 RepID=UPI000AA61642|nr:hypothetical protein [Helicobacter trogontum]